MNLLEKKKDLKPIIQISLRKLKKDQYKPKSNRRKEITKIREVYGIENKNTTEKTQ
jgi:hypothetical protein